MKICKYRFHLLIAFSLSLACLSAQTPDSSGVYSIASIMPSYQGGDEALYEFINQNILYPKEALDVKKSGAVQMRVVIDEQGNVSNIKVVRGIYPALDEEAKRVISATSGKWISGKVDDKPVKAYKYLKVSFKIDTSAAPQVALAAKQPISFIGGDEAFYNFIRKYIQVPHAVYLHSELWGSVTTSVSFNSLNQITDVTLLKGVYKNLDEEAIRLIRMSQGKWIRTDTTKMTGPITAIVTIPFNTSMIDSNDKSKFISEDIIITACNSNPTFKRAYDNYKGRNYDVAMIDLEDCINKKENLEAALVIRAFCYLNTENYPAACEDLMKLKMTTGMDSRVQEIYYKYCADPDALARRHQNR